MKSKTLKLATAAVGIGAMLAVMGASSFAQFTAQTSDPSSNSFVAGHLAITAIGSTYHESTESYNGQGGGKAGYDMTNNMAPGDTWTKTLTITNTGSLPELYQVTVNTSGELFQKNPFMLNGVTSKGNEATVAISGMNGTKSVSLITGAEDQNPQTSGGWILIDPNNTETLTVSVALPYAANNAYQNAAGGFTIAVNAQQADNNAKSSKSIQLTETSHSA